MSCVQPNAVANFHLAHPSSRSRARFMVTRNTINSAITQDFTQTNAMQYLLLLLKTVKHLCGTATNAVACMCAKRVHPLDHHTPTSIGTQSSYQCMVSNCAAV